MSIHKHRNMETDDHHSIKTYMDFLLLKDHRFILWRLLRTEELDTYWATFIAAHPELRDEFERAVAVCDSLRINERHDPDTEALFQRIQRTIGERQRKRARIVSLRRLAGAAALILLLLIPTLYRGFYRSQQAGKTQDAIVGQIMDSRQIELILGDRRVVLHDSAELKVQNGKVVCDVSQDMDLSAAEGQLCKIVVPAGKHSFLTLPDRSRVWINSGTEVEFPAAFSRKSREIRVRGEIFIDVAKRPKHPFIVHTDQMDVTVSGTSFNVSAYASEARPSVVLVEGKVDVATRQNRHMTLRPSEQVVLSHGNLSKKRVDVSYYTSWKNGYFAFNNTPVNEVLEKVGRYYNIRFAKSDAGMADKKISGKLFLADNVDDVLTAISLITSTEYHRENNTVRLMIKERR